MAQGKQQPGKRETKDDVRSAPESGDPKESGRQEGRIIDKFGEGSRKDAPAETDLESGRHGTK